MNRLCVCMRHLCVYEAFVMRRFCVCVRRLCMRSIYGKSSPRTC